MNTIKKLQWSSWYWQRKVRVPKSFQFWKRWESFCFLQKLWHFRTFSCICLYVYISSTVNQAPTAHSVTSLIYPELYFKHQCETSLKLYPFQRFNLSSDFEIENLLHSCCTCHLWREILTAIAWEALSFWCTEIREIGPWSVSSLSLRSAPQWLVIMTPEMRQWLNKQIEVMMRRQPNIYCCILPFERMSIPCQHDQPKV